MPEPVRWPRDDYVAAVWVSDLKPLQRLVAFCYADHAGDSDQSFVAPARLQQRTGLSRDAAQRAARELVDAGWLVVVQKATQHRTTRYRLTVPPAARPLWTDPVDEPQQSSSTSAQQSSSTSADGSSSRPPDTSGRPRRHEHSAENSAERFAREAVVPVIVEPADRRPDSVAFVVDEIRAAAASWSGDEAEVREALGVILDGLRPEELSEDLARPVLLAIIRGKSPSRLSPYVRSALRREGVDRWVERARSGTRPGRRRSEGEVEEKPPKCDQCDQQRQVELPDGRVARCPRCHPRAVRAAS